MANVISRHTPTTEEQLTLMREDARYDVADEREGGHVCIPDPSLFSDISAPQPPPKVPKVFLSNNCTFNCAYCGCRCSNESRTRYAFEPADLARIAVAEAEKNGHGVFITSAVDRNADYTEERIVAALRHIRQTLGYVGYVHAKVMPGTDPLLIREAGRYADRLSVNIEVAKSEGYARIAKQKNRTNILTPMQQISDMIRDAGQYRGRGTAGRFASSQTTQLMAGSTGETDRTILTLSQALYRRYRLKRVYYTAFQYRHPARGYDLEPVSTPLWRMRRLYQADRLMQLYGFQPEEIAPEDQPDLQAQVDPKLAWALRNLHLFPVEVNTADYEQLLRVPGIGIVYAKKILRARRWGTVTHEGLSKIGVSLKRSLYFIQCNGQYRGGRVFDNPARLYALFGADASPVAEQLSF